MEIIIFDLIIMPIFSQIVSSIFKTSDISDHFSQVLHIRVLLAYDKDTLPICFASLSPKTANRITMRYSKTHSHSKNLTMAERVNYWADATEKELWWLHIRFLKPMVVLAFYLPEPIKCNKMIRFPQEIFHAQFYRIINVK